MKKEVLVLKWRAYSKVYENPNGEYLVGVNMGTPFVIPVVSKTIYKKENKIFYTPDMEREQKTRFVLISDGSYDGASIIDLDSKYIVYPTIKNTTNIKNESVLESQIILNENFLPLYPNIVKEIIKNDIVIRIFRVGILNKKYVYLNDITKNKSYFPNIEQFDFDTKTITSHFKSQQLFFEFLEKDKAYVIKNWWKVEYL